MMKTVKFLIFFLFFLLFAIKAEPVLAEPVGDCFEVSFAKVSGESLPSPGDSITVRVTVENRRCASVPDGWAFWPFWLLSNSNSSFFDPAGGPWFDLGPFTSGQVKTRDVSTTIKAGDTCNTGTTTIMFYALFDPPGTGENEETGRLTVSDQGAIGANLKVKVYMPNGVTPANGATITISGTYSRTVTPAGNEVIFYRLNCQYNHTVSARLDSLTGSISGISFASGQLCNGQERTVTIRLSPPSTPTPTATPTPTGTPPPTPTGCPGMTCRYSEPVPTGTCASGYRWVTGTGCTGDNCVGCTYVDGCSTTTCIPVVTPTSTPPPIWGCYQFKCHVTIDGDRQLCYDSTGAYRYTSQCTPRWCVDNDTGPIWCWPEANVDCTPNAADCTPPTPTPTPTPIPCTDPRKAINAYVTPTPGLAGQPISFTFTSNWGYTGTRLDTGGGTTGGCPFSMPTPPDGKTYAWRWACTAISNPRPSPPYTASFTNTQNCPKTISYTVVPNTGIITGRLFEDINNNQCLNLPPDLLASFTNQLTFNLSFRTVTNIYPCSVIWATREFTCANIPGGVSGGLNVVPAGMDPYTGWYCAGDNNCQNQNCTSFSVTGGGTATRHLGFVRGAWWQTKLGDVRAGGVGTANGDLTDRIPSACTPPACSPYVSLTEGTQGPGVVSYKGYLEPVNLTVSSRNWKVRDGFQGRTAYSYDYVMERVRQTGTPTQAFNFNPPQTASGVYTAGPGTIPQGTRWNIPGTSKIVVLVDGDLTIKREIRVAQGGFLAIFVKGDILIDPSIKEPAASVNTDLEGIFVADGSFKTGIVADAAGRLNIAGTVVVDADLNGSGGLLLQRNLGVRNSSYPSFYVSYRPDFLLSAPALLQTKTFSWQEVSP